MAFKPYCNTCATWHTEAEGHVSKETDPRDAEIARLRLVLSDIAEFCSTDSTTLGALQRLAAIRNSADQALR